MTTVEHRFDARGYHVRENASVLPGTPGVPWWAAVLVAFVPTAIGFVIDLGGTGELSAIGWSLTIGGLALATLAVRRHALFTAVVQPPLVVMAGLIAGFVIAGLRGVLNLALNLVNTFPLMVTATAVCLVLGLIRLLAQPLRFSAADRHAMAATRSANHR